MAEGWGILEETSPYFLLVMPCCSQSQRDLFYHIISAIYLIIDLKPALVVSVWQSVTCQSPFICTYSVVWCIFLVLAYLCRYTPVHSEWIGWSTSIATSIATSKISSGSPAPWPSKRKLPHLLRERGVRQRGARKKGVRRARVWESVWERRANSYGELFVKDLSLMCFVRAIRAISINYPSRSFRLIACIFCVYFRIYIFVYILSSRIILCCVYIGIILG